MSKRIILVYPKIVTGWEARPRRAIPMSLLCVASPLINAGYEVTLIDQRVEPRWMSILKEEIRKKPLCVGITSMTGPQLRYALEVSTLVKQYGNSPVVWGGVHASLLPAQTLESEYIDIIVEGEGEETFLELVQALDTGRSLSAVRGIWYKDNGQAKNTGARPLIDMNTQLVPAYQLLDLRNYIRMLFGIEHLDFFTSLGCPRKCTFCYNKAFHERKWRAMDADLVVQRIKDFVHRYSVRGLHFTDSNFFLDVTRGRQILKGLANENIDISIASLNIDFITLTKMDDDDFRLLERAQCRRLPIAVESGSKRIQNLIRKSIDVQKLLKLNQRLKNYGMALHYAFMMGFPTETKDDLSETIMLALRLLKENPKADASFNIFTPYPGTELFDIVLKHGLRFPESIEEWVPFTYRNLTQGGPWLSDEMRQLVQVLDFCTFFMGKRPFLKPYEKTSLWASSLGKIYAPFAQQRIKHLWVKLPIEVKLAKFLGLYAGQG